MPSLGLAVCWLAGIPRGKFLTHNQTLQPVSLPGARFISYIHNIPVTTRCKPLKIRIGSTLRIKCCYSFVECCYAVA